MTGQIVMGRDGTRYRRTGRFADEGTQHGTPTARACRNGDKCDCPVAERMVEHSYVQMSQGIFWENVRNPTLNKRHGTPTYEILTELPRIPDWPILGPAPQFLSDSEECRAGEGDWTCYVFQHPTDWGLRVQFNEETFDSKGQFRLRGVKGRRVYLIARSDPGKDA